MTWRPPYRVAAAALALSLAASAVRAEDVIDAPSFDGAYEGGERVDGPEAPAASTAQAGGALPQPGALSGDDALIALLDAARDGSGDPDLPYVLVRLKRALGEQDLIGFLDLVDPAFFNERFVATAGEARSPGEALAAFACGFLGVCDVAKRYGFADVVSMRLISVGRMDTPLDQPVPVVIELRMWDGVLIQSEILYSRQSYRLSSGGG